MDKTISKQVIQTYLAGNSLTQTAQMVGVSRTEAYRVCKAVGVNRSISQAKKGKPHRSRLDRIKPEALRLYGKGKTVVEVGTILGVHCTTVARWCRKAGVLRPLQDPSKPTLGNLSETDKAYLAGLFDGDGYVGIRKGHTPRGATYWSLTMNITNTVRAPMDKYRELTNVGVVYRADGGNSVTPAYRWAVCSKEAERLLREIIPYLQIKSEQASLAIEFRSKSPVRLGGRISIEEAKRRDDIWMAIKRLNGTDKRWKTK